MTNSLDTLLERLDKLDEKRTPGKWVHAIHSHYDFIKGEDDCRLATDLSPWDVRLIVEAVNTNATLREVIRVLSSALEECKIIKEPTPDQTFRRIETTARKALELVEEICKK